MLIKQDKNKARQKRHLRVRNHIAGTAARPRLNVFRSLKNIYAQIIDDEKGVTLVSASSKDKGFSQYGGNVASTKLALNNNEIEFLIVLLHRRLQPKNYL